MYLQGGASRDIVLVTFINSRIAKLQTATSCLSVLIQTLACTLCKTCHLDFQKLSKHETPAWASWAPYIVFIQALAG
jgi:hypothetical protein